MRLNFKMTITMLTFSLLVTGVILGSFFFLRNNVESISFASALGENVYIMGEEATVQSKTNLDVSESKNGETMNISMLDKAYRDELFKYLPAMVLVICSAVLLLTFLLWLVLRKIYSNQIVAITHDLTFIDQLPKNTVKDEVLSEAFNKLKDKFDGHLEDYRRLNSYLTHEQKNAIAILRTNLEIERQSANQGNLALLDRLTDSIDDILTLSNNTSDLGEEVVDVSLVCAEVCDAYKKNYPNLLFQFDEEASTLIKGRDRWIYRAVSNLVDNAIKYGEGKLVTVTITNQNESVIIEVRDQGIGIPQEKQSEIFSHHYRVNGLKQDGYGIGLSVVSHVCDLCRGFVYLESMEKLGSTFYLSFPSVG
ncbi:MULTISPECIES: sensor histidine kinase [Enterococcus]|uniref:histidine kinase n=1 Tax=Candidatus Enterococcus murrayae TaxID=2815321 RepID=A0ABS3HFY0_9ENTE|nr:HAMP domain-containing sensor histidine kinase [Enterococcus sp. MJM16]MBO0452347.1 HAMP domain-containing histidine kinase [Enterococcus sp. MJM16]